MRAGVVPFMRSHAFAAACGMPESLKDYPDPAKPFNI